MPSIASPGWVTLFLRPSLSVALGAANPEAQFSANGVQYHPAYPGEIIATYDRLIAADGSLVGFQVWPAGGAPQGLFDELPHRAYLHASPGSHFNILCAPVSLSEVATAGVQSLVGQVYRSTTGELAIAMDLTALMLEPGDLEIIAALVHA
ncbi:MAG: hypothetical protein ACREN6_06975 [Gemmatimonadaceae bacterium]